MWGTCVAEEAAMRRLLEMLEEALEAAAFAEEDDAEEALRIVHAPGSEAPPA
jgi:hypothetical protein